MLLTIEVVLVITTTPRCHDIVSRLRSDNFLKESTNFTGKYQRRSLFLIILQVGGPQLYQKDQEALAQFFSCEIFKNTYHKNTHVQDCIFSVQTVI